MEVNIGQHDGKYATTCNFIVCPKETYFDPSVGLRGLTVVLVQRKSYLEIGFIPDKGSSRALIEALRKFYRGSFEVLVESSSHHYLRVSCFLLKKTLLQG